jgi:hypothetical protein
MMDLITLVEPGEAMGYLSRGDGESSCCGIAEINNKFT